MRVAWAVLLSAGLIAGCGGADDAPAAGTPADPVAASPMDPATGPAGATQGDTGGVDPTILQREVFSYGGAGRDPFLSLLRSGEVRPLLEDLRVTNINYDNQFPMNSVAVLRDTRENQRYAVRVGDQVGRLRIAAIRPREIVLAYDEFGRELQDTLRLSRTQGGTQ